MCNQPVNIKETIIILFPFDIKNVYRAHLYGDYENFKDNVKMFFTKKLVDTQGSKICKNIFKSSDISISSNQNKIISNWILIDIENEVLFIKQMKLKGDFQNCSRYNFLWICYNFKLFSLCEFLSMETVNHDSKESYFKYLKDKINMEMSIKKERVRASLMNQIRNLLFNIMLSIILKLSTLSVRILPVTQYFNIAIHIDNYLNGFLWAIKSIKENNRVSIKVTNFLLSVLMDMLFGIIFLNWLNTKVSLDSSASLFLLTTESVVESIKSLINWLRGDPAGLKLNWAFNKILATFFSFHIEIWWTFLGK